MSKTRYVLQHRASIRRRSTDSAASIESERGPRAASALSVAMVGLARSTPVRTALAGAWTSRERSHTTINRRRRKFFVCLVGEGEGARDLLLPPREMAESKQSTDVDLGGIAFETRKAIKIADVDARFTTRAREEDEGRTTRFRIAVAMTISSIIFYFAGNIYAQRSKFPAHFAWWDRQTMTAPQGQGRHLFGMYQVATAAYHTSVQWVVNATTLWAALSQKGAIFLMHCVTYFEENPRTRGKLSSLHWAGAAEQTGAQFLFAPAESGWASVCGAETLEGRKANLRRNWIASRGQNIWYDFFPDPELDPNAFFGVQIFSQVLDMDCTEASSKRAFDVFKLFDGGLCGVAHREVSDDESAIQLFFRFFGVESRAPAMCYGMTEAAISGAAMGGTGSLAMAEVFEHLSKQGMEATSMKFGAGVLGVSVLCGVAGAFLSQSRAQEECNNHDTRRRNAAFGRT